MKESELEGWKLHWRSVGPGRRAELLEYFKRKNPKELAEFVKALKVKTVDDFVDALLEAIK